MHNIIISKPYEYNIHLPEVIGSFENEFTRNIISRLKECENQVQNHFKGPSNQKLAMKIQGIVFISLAAIAAIFTAVSFAIAFLPFTVTLIIGVVSAAALTTGIVLTVLGFNKQNSFEEYLDNCPYYQGLTQMLNGDYQLADLEFKKYTTETQDVVQNNQKVLIIDDKVFNDRNKEKKLSENDSSFEIMRLYFKATRLLRIRELDIELKNLKEKNLSFEIFRPLESDILSNWQHLTDINLYPIDVNLPEYDSFTKIQRVILSGLNQNRNTNKIQDHVNSYRNLSIPSLKTSPNLFTIKKR